MKLVLNSEEINLLSKAGIKFSPEQDYTDDQAFALLDEVYDRENFFAQEAETNNKAKQLAVDYAHLADKIQAAIPE